MDDAVRNGVWKDTPAGGRNVKPRVTRVPSLRPRKLTWKLSQWEFSQCSSKLLANVERLVFYGGGRGRLFGNGDIDIAKFESLPSLQQLTFGDEFNQVINEVVWPASLRKLEFGNNFNQPIHEVAWPTSLQQLTFGKRFDQPINEVVWPTSLRKQVWEQLRSAGP